MARRNLVDIDNKIIQAVMEIGASEGARNVTAVKVAKKCDISHFTCFEHFGTKKGMLDAAAEYFDRKYMAFMAELVAGGSTVSEVWEDMLDAFLEDSVGSMFYNSYTLEYGFDPTAANARSGEFLKMAKLFFGKRNLSDDEYLILWDYVTSMAFYYAEKILHGYIENSEKMRTFINGIIMRSIQEVPRNSD